MQFLQKQPVFVVTRDVGSRLVAIDIICFAALKLKAPPQLMPYKDGRTSSTFASLAFSTLLSLVRNIRFRSVRNRALSESSHSHLLRSVDRLDTSHRNIQGDLSLTHRFHVGFKSLFDLVEKACELRLWTHNHLEVAHGKS